MMRRFALSLILCLLPGLAAAQVAVFTRVGQSNEMEAGQFHFTYALEARRGLSEYMKPGAEPGGGQGGGLGGKRDYTGVNHRLQAAVGVTDWLTLSLDQTLKQPAGDQLDMGVMVPGARVRLNELIGPLAGLPFELSSYVASRVRLNARRPSSMVMGLGIDRALGATHLAPDLAFETSLAATDRQNGMRYELGAGWRLAETVHLAAEAWGALVWPEAAVFQQDHHLGPSLKIRLSHLWLGLSVAAGVKERPAKVFLDLGGMMQLGMGF